MTTHPIDTEALREHLRRLIDASAGPGNPTVSLDDLRALLDALAAAEHRATRAEAQNADEIRAVAAMTVYSEQALQEAAELMHSVKLAQAEARIQAVADICDLSAEDAEDMDAISAHYASGYEIALQDIRRALDGTVTPRDAG